MASDEEVRKLKEENQRLKEELGKSQEEASNAQRAYNEIYKEATKQSSDPQRIQSIQVETLSRQLLKEHTEHLACQRELPKAQETIASLEKEVEGLKKKLDEAKTEIEGLRNNLTAEHETRLQAEKDLLVSSPGINSDWEKRQEEKLFDEDLLDLSPHSEARKKKGMQDFIELLVRLGRIKFIDVGIILDTDKDLIRKWADALAAKNLLEISDPKSPDPTFIATPHLLAALKRRKDGRGP
ncbi:Uncharacterised protein [uncultured archaeon]|nr:Uncharacterised protein [uncultured archaeon]